MYNNIGAIISPFLFNNSKYMFNFCTQIILDGLEKVKKSTLEQKTSKGIKISKGTKGKERKELKSLTSY